jgi:cytochrome c oxidase subunit 2
MASKWARKSALWIAGLLGMALPGLASALEWDLPRAASPVAAEIHTLHNYVMLLVIVIFVGVFGVMFYSVFAHRKSKGHKAAQFHENTTAEILWTVIPAIILVVIALPATKTVIWQKDTSDPDLTIKATGYQWKWGYDYVQGEGTGIHFLSTLSTPYDEIIGKAPKDEHYLLEVDHPLVVPVNKKVRILATAGDVIHSWWVPAFGVKQDAIPGIIRDTWFRANRTGTFRGQCAELCGKNHAFMPIVVKVVTQDQYDAWVKQQKTQLASAAEDENKKWTLDELKAHGEKVYAANCVACHQATGLGIPGTFPPIAAGHPFQAAPQMLKELEDRGFYKDGKVVEGPADHHIDIVLNGIPGTAMAPFGKQLSDTDIASVITYERNSWGNGGGLVQPAEVRAQRK